MSSDSLLVDDYGDGGSPTKRGLKLEIDVVADQVSRDDRSSLMKRGLKH